MSFRETAQQAATSRASAAIVPSVVKPEMPATAQPSPELAAHALSCSSLSGSDCAATRVADSPCGDRPASAAPAATAAESVVSPRTVAAMLVRISVRSTDGVTSTPDVERGSFNRRSGSSEQCHPDGAAEAALAPRHSNANSPLPTAGGQAELACAAARALPVPLWPALGRLPLPPAAYARGYVDRSPMQQQQGQAADAAVRGLDTSNILQQAAALTANAVGNRLWDLAPSALLAMHKQAQQHEQQHRSLGPPHPALASSQDSSALASQAQQPATQLLPPRQYEAPFAAHDLFLRGGGGGGGVNPLALLQFQQQLAAVQQQPRQLEQLLMQHSDRADQGAHLSHQTLAIASEAFDPDHGGRKAGDAPPVRSGLQSTSVPATAAGAAERSGRRVVSGNEAAAQGARDDSRAGVGGGQAVTLRDMQHVAAALFQQHRETMVRRGSPAPGGVKLPPPDDEADRCVPAEVYSGCCPHALHVAVFPSC